MPFMGANSADYYEHGTRAGLSGGTTMVVDFCIPGRGQPFMEAMADWTSAPTRDRRLLVPPVHHLLVRQGARGHGEVVPHGVTLFKHFMAYKGSLMVNDEELLACSCVRELGALPWSTPRTGDPALALQKHFSRRASPGRRVPRCRARRRSKARRPIGAIIPADEAGFRSTSCTPPAFQPIKRSRATARSVSGSTANRRSPPQCPQSESFSKDWAHAARRVMSPPFRDKKHQDNLWTGLRAGSLQVVATDHCSFTTRQKELGLGDFTKFPTAPVVSRIVCRCCGPMASTPAA